MLRNALRRLAKPPDKCPDGVPRRLPDLRPENNKRPDVRDGRARVGAAEDSKRPRRPRKVPRQARVEAVQTAEGVDGRESTLAPRRRTKRGRLCVDQRGAAASPPGSGAPFVADAPWKSPKTGLGVGASVGGVGDEARAVAETLLMVRPRAPQCDAASARIIQTVGFKKTHFFE